MFRQRTGSGQEADGKRGVRRTVLIGPDAYRGALGPRADTRVCPDPHHILGPLAQPLEDMVCGVCVDV